MCYLHNKIFRCIHLAEKLVKILTIESNAFLNPVAYYCSSGKWPSQYGTRTGQIQIMDRLGWSWLGSIFLGPGPRLGNNFVLGHPWIRSGVEFPVFEILFIIFVIFKKWFTFGEKFKNVRSSNSIYFSSHPETKSISKGKIHN